MGVIIFLVSAVLIGALAGWLTGKIMHFRARFWANAALGIFGYLVGSLVAGLLGFNKSNSIVANLLISVLGACLITLLIRKFNDGKAGI